MICKKNECTGCFACYNICPKKCITMEEDELGFIYPKIDKSKCINCGACKKVCPQLDQLFLTKPFKAYALCNKDNEKRMQSTSGGLATMLYEWALKKGGIVYGCSQEQNEVKFIRTENAKQLYKLKQSKYVHAYVYDMFSRVKSDLNNDRIVLFVGTPCQISGLKKYLRKDYDNLYLIDIICHGVPSQKMLKDEINRKKIKNVGKILFRDHDKYKFRIFDNQGKEVVAEKIYENPYLFAFFNGINLRPNCYNCRYATDRRISDMTIGDFWGIKDSSKFSKEKELGISLALPVTKKGEFLLSEIKEHIYIEEHSVEEAIKGNTQLQRPSLENKKSKIFRKTYVKENYDKAIKKYMFGEKSKGKIKEVLKTNRVVYNLYKIIKKK